MPPAEDHLAVGRRLLVAPAAAIGDAAGPASVEQDLCRLSAGQDGKVGSRQGGVEEGAGRAPAPTVLDVAVITPEAFLGFAVEVVGQRVTRLTSGLDIGAQDRIVGAGAANEELATAAVIGTGTLFMVFGPLEVWQDLTVAPAAIAEPSPGVEVGGMAPDIEHAGDHRAAAEHLGARPVDLPAVHPCLGLGLVVPIAEVVSAEFSRDQGNSIERVAATAARFEQ